MDDNANKSRNGRNRHRASRKPHQANTYTPPYAEEVLAKPIDQIGLSEQTVAVLTAGRIVTVLDIAKRRKGEMFRVQNFGKRHLVEVTRVMVSLGVDFRPDDKPQETEANAAERTDKRPNDKKERKEREQREEDRRGDKKDRRDRDAKQGAQQPKPQDRRDANRDASRDGQGRDNRDKQGKGKNKPNGAARYEDNLTLDKIFPKPPMVRLPRIEQETDEFVKFQRGGKWGFKNKQGMEIIPPIYDEVFNFKEDYACVERKQLFGFINRQNELVIPYKYVCASSFSEGYACVSDEEKCGYINKAGEVVIPFKYEAGTAVKDGLAHVKLDGKWGTLNIATNTISWA